MSLLFPLSLLAGLALVVPLALHLLTRDPGVRRLVGSVRLIAASPTRHRRQVRLRDPLLLAVRLGLMALLALAAAHPIFQRTESAAPTRETVLIDGSRSLTPKERETALTALSQKSTPWRAFVVGTDSVRGPFETVAALRSGLSRTTAFGPLRWREAIRQASGDTLTVWTDGRRTGLPDTLTAPVPIRWRTVGDGKRNRWWQRVTIQPRPDGGATLDATLGESTTDTLGSRSGRIELTAAPTQLAALAGLPIRVDHLADRWRLQLVAPDALGFDDTLTLSVPTGAAFILHRPDAATDARILTAALRAVSPSIRVGSGPTLPDDLAAFGTVWALGLGTDTARLGSFVRTGGTLIIDDPASGAKAEPARLDPNTLPPSLAALADRPLPFYPTPDGFGVRWRTVTGRPALTVRPDGRGRRVWLGLRLNPATWPDVTRTALLPTLIADGLADPVAGLNRPESNLYRRLPVVKLVAPPPAADPAESLAERDRQQGAWRWLLVAALGLIAVDRWIATRSKTARG